jgi:hypothetical protein
MSTNLLVDRFAGHADARPAFTICMDPTEPGNLYRALPPEVALVIEPECS